VFACGSANVATSDVEGRMAVAGDASLRSYSIGATLPASNGSRDDLIVGGALTYNSGQVYAGNAVYGSSASISNLGLPSGSLLQGTPLDFAGECANLTMLSDNLCLLAGSNVTPAPTLHMNGSDSSLNVFYVGAAALGAANGVQIHAPANATVVINVTGTPASMAYMGITVGGTDREHVVWNFCDATQLTLQGIQVEGSVLAPYTDVTFNNGQINGMLITDDLTGNGESHNHAFAGCGF